MVDKNVICLSLSFICAIILNIFYLSKDCKGTYERHYYADLLILNVFGIIIDISARILAFNYGASSFIYLILTKSLLFYNLTFLCVFIIYELIAGYKKQERVKEYAKRIKILIGLLWFVALCSIGILPIYISSSIDNSATYPTGPGYRVLLIIRVIAIIISLYIIIKNIISLKKKHIPIFAFLIEETLCIVLQFYNPLLLPSTIMGTILLVIMYLCLMDDKSPKLAVKNIVKQIDNTKESISSTEPKDESINVVTNVYKYNLPKLLNECFTRAEEKLKGANIKLNISVANDIPEILYGDCENIKNIINDILDTSIMSSDEGIIEVKVECILKTDIAKIIVAVKDSGTGLTHDEVEKLNEDNLKEASSLLVKISKIKNLANQMNIKFVIESDKMIGSKYIIATEQSLKNIYGGVLL